MRAPAMTPLRSEDREASASSEHRAGERAYNAFIEAIQEWSPPNVQSWSEMHAKVRSAWIKSATAARESS